MTPTASATPDPDGGSRRWSWWLVPIIGCAVGLPLLIAALSGNLTIPHNDGWSYSLMAEHFARTGQLRMIDWGAMTLIGQIVMLGPLGRWLAVQQVAVAVLAALALWCAYLLIRNELPRRRALFATALLAAWPGLATLSNSFMTDAPALAGMLGCLALGQSAIRRDSRTLFVAALLVGGWTFTVREQAIAALAAVILGAHFTRRPLVALNRRTILACGAVTALALAAFWLWRMSLPGAQPQPQPSGVFTGSIILALLGPSYFELALIATPALLLGTHPLRWRRNTWIVVLLVIVLGLLTLNAHGDLLIGNYFTYEGSYPDVFARLLVPLWTVRAIHFVTLCSGALLAGEITERWRSVNPLLSCFTALQAGILLVTAFSNQGLNDRYLLPLAPWVLIVALSQTPAAQPVRDGVSAATSDLGEASPSPPIRLARRAASRLASARLPLAATALTVLVLISAGLALNTFSRDRTQWSTGEALVAAGVPATRIDDGGPWDGWHAPGPILNVRGFVALLGYGRAEPQLPCAVVEAAPLATIGLREAQLLLELRHPLSAAGWTLRSVTNYRTYLLFGRSRFYIYDTHAAGCPR